MKNIKIFFLFISFVALLLGFVSCGAPLTFSEFKNLTSKNTIAGNPLTAVSEKLTDKICSVISRCHDISMAQCKEGLLNVPGFGTPLKLPSNYSTLAEILSAEQLNLLAINASTENSCYQSIEQLSCSNPAVKNAYNSLTKDPLADSVNLVSGETCGKILVSSTSYSCDSKVFVTNAVNTSLAPFTTVQNTNYSISPALPNGLTLDAKTGMISGSPALTTPMTTYTISASTPNGVIQNSIQIKTADGYVVNDLSDDSNAGGTVCKTATSGNCSLRAAIEASIASNTSKVILLPPGTIQLSSKTSLNISQGLEIYGDCQKKTVIDGIQATRIFYVTAGPTTLDHLDIENGLTINDPGAGITIDAETTTITTNLTNLKVSNNKIDTCTSGFCDGAGIHAFGTSDSIQAIVNLSNSEISNNVNFNGNFGAGMGLWFNTQANINNCTFSENQNNSYGGGLSSRSGGLVITNTLFYKNSSGGEGGGLYVDHQAYINPTLTNVTFDSNSADTGGGIYLGGMSMTINNSTFANNTTVSQWYAGAIATMGQQITVQNTIFANNTSNGVLAHCAGNGNKILVSGGNNLSDSTADDCNLTTATDLVQQNADLLSLQDNGGATKTMALLSVSPAINKGNPNTCSSVDQRNFPRLNDGKCDIGSFEFY
ncbi:MAG: choice-of-anchor Q domain-containing protein [Bdellovibrio sp.]